MDQVQVQVVKKIAKASPRFFPNRAARLYWDLQQSPVPPVIFPSSRALTQHTDNSENLKNPFVIASITSGVIGVTVIVALMIGVWIFSKCSKKRNGHQNRSLMSGISSSELTRPTSTQNMDAEYTIDMASLPISSETQVHYDISNDSVTFINEHDNSSEDLLKSVTVIARDPKTDTNVPLEVLESVITNPVTDVPFDNTTDPLQNAESQS